MPLRHRLPVIRNLLNKSRHPYAFHNGLRWKASDIIPANTSRFVTIFRRCHHYHLRLLASTRISSPPARMPSIIIFDEKSQYLHCLNPRNNTVTPMHEYNDGMKMYRPFSSVSIGSHIYILMGRLMYRLKYCEIMATWKRMADLIEEHGFRPPAFVASGSIIIAGGSDNKFTKSVTKFDSLLNRWEKLKDKKLDTRNSANVASQGFVFCIGGKIEEFKETDVVERLSVNSQSWGEVASIREARYDASAVECRGNLFVAGGFDRYLRDLNSVEKYDIDVNQWTITKPMTMKRWRFRCHVIDENIYAVGFGNAGIEKYDVESDDWEVVQVPEAKNLYIYESVLVKMKN